MLYCNKKKAKKLKNYKIKNYLIMIKLLFFFIDINFSTLFTKKLFSKDSKMLKVINELICCKLCRQILNNPVLLPCGETICEKHEELFRVKSTSRCQFCDKDHKLGRAEHFPLNKMAAGFLAGEISKLDFGESYKHTTKLMEGLNDVHDKYSEIRSKAEDLISAKFLAMRNKVALVREQIIQRVKSCSAKILAEIDSAEHDCKANVLSLDSKMRLEGAVDLSKIKAELKAWESKMNKL